MEDLKPFSDFFTVKNVTIQFTKSILIPANTIVFEYNNFLMKVMEEKDMNKEEEFLWEDCLKRNWHAFISSAKRFYSVSFIKKVIESIVEKYIPLKYADKLTKDVTKSMFRKCAKYTKFEACRRIFSTSIWANAILLYSSFLYDFSVSLHSQWPSGKDVTLSRKASFIALLLLKKSLIFSLSLCSSSLGFAVGAYFNIKYCAPLLSGVVDLITMTAVGGSL